MNSPLQPEDDLEQWVDRVLQNQPLRQAPATLEARVLAELGRRAALPWWRKSFLQWPVLARSIFIAISLGVVKLALVLTERAAAGADAVNAAAHVAAPLGWIQGTIAFIGVARDVVVVITNSIPVIWLYGLAGVMFTLYAVVFGVGAAAYRTLYSTR